MDESKRIFMQIVLSFFIKNTGCDVMEFILQKDEKIIKEIKPKKAMIGIQLVPAIFGLLLITLFIAFNISAKDSTIAYNYLVALFIATAVLILLIIFLIIYLMYSKEYYWITNKRIAIKKGVLGYSITSIPYSKISDLAVSRSFLESIFKVGSIYIQTLAGQMSRKNVKGAEGYLIALKNPEEVQEIIFKEMK